VDDHVHTLDGALYSGEFAQVGQTELFGRDFAEIQCHGARGWLHAADHSIRVVGFRLRGQPSIDEIADQAVCTGDQNFDLARLFFHCVLLRSWLHHRRS
jgi:hypothetical protein